MSNLLRTLVTLCLVMGANSFASELREFRGIPAPTDLRVVSVGENDVVIEFVDRSPFESGYTAECSTLPVPTLGEGIVVSTRGGLRGRNRMHTWQLSGLDPFRLYHCWIYATYRGVYRSAYSSMFTFRTLKPILPDPIVVSAYGEVLDRVSYSNYEIRLSWEPVEGAVEYIVETRRYESRPWEEVAVVTGDTYEYFESKPFGHYHYRVVAVFEDGQTAYSDGILVQVLEGLVD